MVEPNDQIKKAFEACKSDILNLKTNNTILVEKTSKLEEENKGLLLELTDIKSQLKEIATLLIERKTPEIIEEVKIEKKEDPYESLLAFKAKANKRDLLKQKMLSMIGDNGISQSELKFMFIEHFKYCSKASFYNYIKELELEKVIKIERTNSKNMIQLVSLANLNTQF